MFALWGCTLSDSSPRRKVRALLLASKNEDLKPKELGTSISRYLPSRRGVQVARDASARYGREAQARGLKAIIAGAGGAAHLPGMLASLTSLPVIGVPVQLATLDGMDSLLSIVQMPAGIPVATVSINGAKNAGILAARMLGSSDAALGDRVEAYARDLEAQVEEKSRRLKDAL